MGKGQAERSGHFRLPFGRPLIVAGKSGWC